MSDRWQSASKSRIPRKSTLFEHVVPASLLILAFVTVVLIFFALGVLTGIVRF